MTHTHTHTGVRCGLEPNLLLMTQTQHHASERPRPVALHALGVAPPRAERTRLGVRLLAAIPPEEARLVEAAPEHHTE